jgi:hypothetical protein
MVTQIVAWERLESAFVLFFICFGPVSEAD